MNAEDIERNLKIASETLIEHSKAIKEIDDSLAILSQSVNDLIKSQREGIEENRREWAEMKARFFKVDQLHEEFIANSKIVMDELVNTRLQFKQSNGRLDSIEELHKNTEEKLNRLVEAQSKSSGRLDRVEASLDRLAEAQSKSSGRLDRVEASLDRLAEAQSKSSGRLDRVEASLDRLTEAQSKSNGRLDRIDELHKNTEEKLNRLTEAQIKTNEMIEAFLRDGK
jgi:chromosome segregation ATPase